MTSESKKLARVGLLLFHWGYTFDYGLANANPTAARASDTHVGRPLISGWGWVLGAMRQLLGTGENEDGSIIGADCVRDSASQETLHINNTLGAFRTANPKQETLQYLIVAYSSDYTEYSDVVLTLAITNQDFPGGKPFWDLADSSAVVILSVVLVPC